MVYSIDSVDLNYGHMYPTQFKQIFSSTYSVQHRIIPNGLTKLLFYRWKEEILSVPMMCHTSKSVTCI